MKNILVFMTISILLACEEKEVKLIEHDPPILQANTEHINDVVGGYYSAVPSHYAQNDQTYPLIICLHGGGQYGDGNNDLKKILSEAIPALLAEELFPPSFFVNGVDYSFVILTPQFSSRPTEEEVISFVDFANAHYRIDPTRIYLTGFSEGGRVACDVAAKFPLRFAAVVAIAGVSKPEGMRIKCESIASNELPVWVLHNDKDELMDIQAARDFISLINERSPAPISKLTQMLPYGLWNHDAWTKSTDPGYKVDGANIYQWMLAYSREKN